MSKTRIDVDIIFFIEISEILFEEVYFVQWYTRVFISKYTKYRSSQLGELSSILRQVTIVDHGSINWSIE